MSQPTIGSQAQYRDLVSLAIESYREELVGVSLDIHAHPELNYEERHAAALLAANLESHGFTVERGIGGVETAFRGTINGSGDGPTPERSRGYPCRGTSEFSAASRSS